MLHGKTGNKKPATYFATLLQNALNSNVARFITHIRPVLQQIRLLTGLNMGSSTRNIAIQLVLQHCCKTSCTFFVATAVWENSWHLATLPLVSPPNDVWETYAEIPYWWRVTTQIWVVTRHQYGISAYVSQTSFGGETNGSVAKCQLFSQTAVATKNVQLVLQQCCKTSWIAMLRVELPMFRPVNNLICCKTGLMWVIKRATLLFNAFCSNVAK